MFRADVSFKGKEFFVNEHQKMGKLSREEIKVAVVIVALVLYLVTMSIHKRGMGWGFMLAACAMFIPGINLGTKQDIRNVNMSVVLFAGSCLSIGTVATSLGVGALLTDLVMPLLAGHGTISFFSVIILVTFILNFIMTPSAIMAVLAGPLAQMSIGLGINPLPMLYVLSSAGYQVMLPYEHTSFLILFSFGLISSKNFMRFFGIAAVLHFIFILLLAVPYWKLIGLL